MPAPSLTDSLNLLATEIDRNHGSVEGDAFRRSIPEIDRLVTQSEGYANAGAAEKIRSEFASWPAQPDTIEAFALQAKQEIFPQYIANVATEIARPFITKSNLAELLSGEYARQGANWLRGQEDRPAIVRALSDHLAAQGFDNLEYLGQGSFAVVVAPKDNPDIVFRISRSLPNERAEIPYMLQRMGYHRVRVDGGVGFTVETVKRLDMEVEPSSLNPWLSEAESHGYLGGSFGRGKEVGKYTYQAADGSTRSVLMAADPSALSEGPTQEAYTHAPAHPSLTDQAAENLRLAKADPRLAEFVPALEEKITQSRPTAAPAASVISRNSASALEEPDARNPASRVNDIAPANAALRAAVAPNAAYGDYNRGPGGPPQSRAAAVEVPDSLLDNVVNEPRRLAASPLTREQAIEVLKPYAGRMNVSTGDKNAYLNRLEIATGSEAESAQVLQALKALNPEVGDVHAPVTIIRGGTQVVVRNESNMPIVQELAGGMVENGVRFSGYEPYFAALTPEQQAFSTLRAQATNISIAPGYTERTGPRMVIELDSASDVAAMKEALQKIDPQIRNGGSLQLEEMGTRLEIHRGPRVGNVDLVGGLATRLADNGVPFNGHEAHVSVIENSGVPLGEEVIPRTQEIPMPAGVTEGRGGVFQNPLKAGAPQRPIPMNIVEAMERGIPTMEPGPVRAEPLPAAATTTKAPFIADGSPVARVQFDQPIPQVAVPVDHLDVMRAGGQTMKPGTGAAPLPAAATTTKAPFIADTTSPASAVQFGGEGGINLNQLKADIAAGRVASSTPGAGSLSNLTKPPAFHDPNLTYTTPQGTPGPGVPTSSPQPAPASPAPAKPAGTSAPLTNKTIADGHAGVFENPPLAEGVVAGGIAGASLEAPAPVEAPSVAPKAPGLTADHAAGTAMAWVMGANQMYHGVQDIRQGHTGEGLITAGSGAVNISAATLGTASQLGFINAASKLGSVAKAAGPIAMLTSFTETGVGAYKAAHGEESWKKVGMTGAANGAELGTMVGVGAIGTAAGVGFAPITATGLLASQGVREIIWGIGELAGVKSENNVSHSMLGQASLNLAQKSGATDKLADAMNWFHHDSKKDITDVAQQKLTTFKASGRDVHHLNATLVLTTDALKQVEAAKQAHEQQHGHDGAPAGPPATQAAAPHKTHGTGIG